MMESSPPRLVPLVLVVDDDITARFLLRAALEQAGFEVQEAGNGRQALFAFPDLRPDVVLLDVMMPEMDGFDTCEAIRQIGGAEHTPIVMVTGVDDTESINRAYEAGATDFITKPINWTILSYRVRYLLRASQESAARQKLEDQLHQSQKMEAIGRLAGGVAHDFNNLLMVIIGCSELLMASYSDQEALGAQIREIKRAAEQAAALTSQLLAFSRKQILKPQTVNLGKIIPEMETMLSRIIGEDVQLTTRLDSEPALVKVDPGQIQQVIMNLVVNARDAMPRGGKLTIETARVALDESYCQQHIDIQPGKYVMLAISDTGMGMDTTTQARIFEPFFTTKDRDKGTGLGLSTVHGIIKQSGGHIWVYSEPGHGTTFKIYLPLRESLEKPTSVRPVGSLDLQGGETILVVEDEEIVRLVVRRILQHYGYTVLEADGGTQALAICEQHAEPVHLLLTDVIMPGMSGKELAEHWVRLRPDTKVLFTSGYTENAIVHHGILEGGIQFLQKPYRPETLALKVQQVLKEHEPHRPEIFWDEL